MIKDLDTLKILLEVSRTVASTLDLDKVSNLILKEATRILGTDHGSLFILDEASGHLILTAARGFSEDELENLKILAGWEEVNQEVARSGELLVVNNVETSPLFKDKKLPLKAFVSAPLKVENKVVGVLNLSNRCSDHFFDERAQSLILALANHAAIALLNATLFRETEEMFLSIVSSLVAAIDAKDPYTCGHSERVTRYALSIAEELNLTKEKIKNLRLSSLLHDVGKIGISEGILSKPTVLDEKEILQIRKHPSIGIKIVRSISQSERLLGGIRDHHERYDGSGYPQGLKAKDISLEGRIIAMADVFDALTSNRPYRKALSPTEAWQQVKRSSSSLFDPEIVEAFSSAFEKGKICN